MNKKLLLGLLIGWLAWLPATLINASSAYFNTVTNLNPAGYWPMHEVETAAPGDIETNFGTLGLLGTGYYPDWLTAGIGASNQLVIQHQVAGALTNSGDFDSAAYFYAQGGNGPTNALYVPHTSPLSTLRPPFSVECWFNGININGNDIWSQEGLEGLNAGASGAGTGNIAGIRLAWGNTGYIVYTYFNSSSQNNLYKNYGSLGSSGVVPAPSNTWNHVVVTCDAQTNIGIYVNGSLAASVPAAGKYLPDYWTPFEVGNGRGNTRAVQGAVDEVAVYTNVIGDISTHYSDGSTGAPGAYFHDVTNDNPLIYLRMDEPAYTPPSAGTWPVLTNYGSVAVNGVYNPGTMPGIVPGPANPGGLPFGGLATGVKVAQLSGMSSFADAGYAAAYNPVGATPFSVAAMFRGNPCEGRVQNIVGHSDNSWRIAMNTNGKLQCGLGTNSSSVVNSAGVYNDGNWHQVVEVYTPNSNPAQAGTNALYVDGVLDSVTNGVSPNGILPGTNLDVIIGSDPQYTNNPSGVGRQFAGQVCETALFTNALSASQVMTLYNGSGVAALIMVQPFSTNINQGAVFTNDPVAASGSSLAYQWFQSPDGNSYTPISGQTRSNLVFNPVLPANAGYWYVAVTNLYSAVTSAVVFLTVNSSATLSQDLIYTNLMLFAGGSTTLAITAAGAQPLYYQWYSNSVKIINATNAGYTLSNAQPANATNNYYCMVTNTAGSASSVTAVVTILPDPAASYPSNVVADHPVGFWRLNESTGVIAFDYWGGNNGTYSNTVLGQPGYNPNETDETSAEFGALSFADGDANDIGGIDFSQTNGGGSAFTVSAWIQGYQQTSDAGIVSKGYGGGEQFDLDCGSDTVSAANPVAHSFRFFVRNAAGTSAGVNSTVNPADNQWHHLVGVCDEPDGEVWFYVDGVLVGSNTIPIGSGILSSTRPMVIGSRSSNSTNDNNLQLAGWVDDVAVFPYAMNSTQAINLYNAGQVPAHITVPPQNVTASQNGTAVIAASAGGTAVIGYQWFDVGTGNPVLDSATIGGSTNASLVLNDVQSSDSYYLQVTNNYGTNVSATVSLNVVSGQPQIFVQPQAQYFVFAGETISIPVSVYGTLPLTNQWQMSDTNGVNWTNVVSNGRITGSQSNVLTIANAQASDAGDYQLAITNAYGSAVSSVANLVVASLPLSLFGDGIGWTANTRGAYSQSAIANGLLTLTGGGDNEGRSVFFDTPQYIGAFQASFTYQDVDLGGADGIAFVLQNDARGTSALGPTPGTGLGVNGITPSFELDLIIVTTVGYAVNTNGNSTAALSLGGVNLKSGDPINVTVDYANGQLALTFTDAVASASFSTNLAVGDLTSILGADTAYVGFTGATGQNNGSTETVTNFSFVSIPPEAIQLSGTNAFISWPLAVSGFVLQQNSNLTATNWVNVLNLDSPSNGLHQVPVPLGGGNQFYRLILQ